MHRRSLRAVAAVSAAALVAAGLSLQPRDAVAADPSIEASKVLELKFEDNLTDTSAAAHPVTMFRGTAAYGAGISGQGFAFEGGGNPKVINLGTATDLQPASLTLSFWYNPGAKPMADEEVLTWSKTVYNSEGWYLSSENDSSPLALSIGASSGQPYKVSVNQPRSAVFPVDTWSHIVVTFDAATKAVKFYRNGEVLPSSVAYGYSASAPGVINGTAAMKSIGFNGPNYNGSYLHGTLDDYLLYSAPASLADVVTLYQQNRPDFDPKAIAQADLDKVTVTSPVQRTFKLQTTGAKGSTITWTSNSPYIQVQPDGTAVVTSPLDGEVPVALTASSTYGGSAAVTKAFNVTVIPGTASPFAALPELADVDLNDAYLKNLHTKNVDYLLSLDSEKFLYSWYIQAGLTPTTSTGYGGWEAATGTRFQGHFFGHYITALAQAYSVEPDSTRKAALLTELTEAVNGLKACQDAMAAKDPTNAGYVAPFPVSYLPNGANGLLVPFCNLHKVLAGLIDAKELAPTAIGDKALGVASGFGTFLKNFGARYTGNLLATEYGGMNEALYELFGHTRNPDHKRAAEYFDEVSLFQSLANNIDVLPGKHANTTIPKLVGAMTRYVLFTENQDLYDSLTDTEKADLDMYRRAATNFWQIVINDHTYANGGNSQSEHFHGADTLYQYATNGATTGYGENSTSEGCNEYNMLKLTNLLWRVTKDVKYADYYESTFLNAVVSTFNPTSGMITYFEPMTAGYAKVFGTPLDEFWCDHGTGIEKATMLTTGFYATDQRSVYVNQFVSSVFRSASHNVKLTQSADIPRTDTATLTVDSIDGGAVKAGAVVRLRIPGWVDSTPTLTINGVAQNLTALPGGVAPMAGYASFTVAKGDVIMWKLPAKVTVVADDGNPNWVAFKYGPVLLATELNRNNVQAKYRAGVLVAMSVADKSVNNTLVVADTAALKASIADNVVRVADKPGTDGITRMQFDLRNADDGGQNLVFEPYYSLYEARYALYMTLVQPDSPEAQALILRDKQQQREAEANVDYLTNFDNNNVEADKNYKLNGDTSVGVYKDTSFRHGNGAGTWFSYELAVDQSAPANYLCVRYYGGDVGRTFDILINGTQFKREVITSAGGATSFYLQCDQIAADQVAAATQKLNAAGEPVVDAEGKPVKVVTVRFQGTGGFIGGVFGIWIKTELNYSTDANLTALSADQGTISPALADGTTAYTLTVPAGTMSVDLNLDPAIASGLVYVDGILIDDTLPRTVAVTPGQVIVIRSVAQDHTTSLTYRVTVVEEAAPTATATATVTTTPSATATVTNTSTATATATTTATATATTTATATVTSTATATATATATSTVTAGPTSTATVTTRPTGQPSASQSAPVTSPAPVSGEVYSTPGFHTINGRWWYTQCEPYSQTIRCTTQIWATQVSQVNGVFVPKTGWVFNNLTYLPYMTKAQWGSNPIANAGEYVINGRTWRTECGSAWTGPNACRSFIWSTFIKATAKPGGGYTYAWTSDWVFNNIVRFKA